MSSVQMDSRLRGNDGGESVVMGRYTAYPEYKYSGVEWLESVPKHWSLKKVRYVLKDGSEGIKIGPFGSALKLDGMVSDGYNVYGQENVIKKDFSLGKRKISAEKFQEMSVYQIVPNDILITMMGTSGKCEIVPEDIFAGIIDSHLLRTRVKSEEINPRFFKILIDETHEIEYQIKTLGKGSIMHGLNSGIVKDLVLPLPNRQEQDCILHFLDHETAKIDSLIEEQQSLIRLLKEKRQAVISHAVTKGLNPQAPVKDSGVEWLGEVPEHWRVAKLKHLILSMDQGWSPQCDSRPAEAHEYGVLKVGCVNGGRFNANENKALPEELSPRLEYVLKKGHLLISRANTKELVGSAAVVDSEHPNLLVCDKLYRITLLSNIRPELVKFLLGTSVYRQQIELGATGASSSMQNIGQDTIKELFIALPTSKEVDEIISHINQASLTYEKLINEANSAIQFMQERRIALISAAVTGKIDVRHWQPSSQQQPATEATP